MVRCRKPLAPDRSTRCRLKQCSPWSRVWWCPKPCRLCRPPICNSRRRQELVVRTPCCLRTWWSRKSRSSNVKGWQLNSSNSNSNSSRCRRLEVLRRIILRHRLLKWAAFLNGALPSQEVSNHNNHPHHHNNCNNSNHNLNNNKNRRPSRRRVDLAAKKLGCPARLRERMTSATPAPDVSLPFGSTVQRCTAAALLFIFQ